MAGATVGWGGGGILLFFISFVLYVVVFYNGCVIITALKSDA